MVADPAFKSLGAISIGLTWAGLIFLLYKWKGNRSLSFSLHAAQTRAGQIYYFFLFVITLPLFYLFVIRWYVPALHLPTLFTVIATIGILGQVIAVLVPAVGGRKEQIHNFGAYLMAFTLIPSSWLVFRAHIPVGLKILTLAAITYMVVATFLFLFVARARAFYLYFQAAYVLAFHAVILTTTYLS